MQELNEVLAAYNSRFAGQLTPHGQRLVAAGLFSEAQLRTIEGVTIPIPLVPEGNPNPFENRFTADFRLTRPIRIWKESWVLEPSLSIFNLFNNSPRGTYTGLALPNVVAGRTGTTVTNFGALNFNYDTEDERTRLDRDVRGLIFNRRQLQFGIRFSF